MNNLDDLRANAKNIALKSTESYLKKLSKKQSFKIQSTYPTINSISCDLKKGKRCYKFDGGEILPFGPPVIYQDKGYGFQDKFVLVNEKMTISVPSGVRSLKIDIGKDFSAHGEISELISSNLLAESYLRAIIPFSNFSKKPTNILIVNLSNLKLGLEQPDILN